MDEFELASQHEALRRSLALALRKPEGPAATGACLCCEAPLPLGLRWCNAECRDDWARITRAERQRPCSE